MRRTLALAAVAAAALAAPASAAPDQPGAIQCFVTYVTRAEPVPQTPEEYVAAAVRDVHRTVTFVTCVA